MGTMLDIRAENGCGLNSRALCNEAQLEAMDNWNQEDAVADNGCGIRHIEECTPAQMEQIRKYQDTLPWMLIPAGDVNPSGDEGFAQPFDDAGCVYSVTPNVGKDAWLFVILCWLAALTFWMVLSRR